MAAAMKPKLLILGANGFIGKYASAYLSTWYECVGLDWAPSNTQDKSTILVDIRDKSALWGALIATKPNYILNLVAAKNTHAASELLLLNAELPRFIMERADELGGFLKKIIFIGSAAEYGNAPDLPITEDLIHSPVSLYGLSKSIQTSYFKYYSKKSKIEMNLVRPFNIIHNEMPLASSIGSFIHNITNTAEGHSFSVGNLQVRRDFVDLRDICQAFHLVLEKGLAHEEYNIASASSHKLEDILKFLIKKSGKKLHYEIPAGAVGETHIMNSFGSFAKLQKDCGWTPNTDVYKLLDEVIFTRDSSI